MNFLLLNHPFYSNVRQKGFALMPLILTVLIMGALIGVGLSILAPRIKKEKYNQSNDTISAAIHAVTSWSVSNNRLPDNSEFPSIVKNVNDDWRKPLVYIYDNDLAVISTGGLCGRQTTGITAGTTANLAFLIVSGGDDYSVNSTPNTSGSFSGNVTASASDVVPGYTG